MKIKIWGVEVLDVEGLEPKETIIHYDHCIFGQPIVTAIKSVDSQQNEERITDEKYLEMVKKVSDKTGFNASEVEWILREAEDYLGGGIR